MLDSCLLRRHVDPAVGESSCVAISICLLDRLMQLSEMRRGATPLWNLREVSVFPPLRL